MSKKVAQLTKVIYLLNTRNDERDFELSCVEAAYEADVEAVLRDAQAKIRNMQERLENKTSSEAAAAGGNAAKAMDEQRRAHEADRRAAQAKLEKLREQSLANETAIKNASKDKMDAMKKEMDEAKTQVSRRGSSNRWMQWMLRLQ